MRQEATVTPPLDNTMVATQVRKGVEALGSQVNRRLEVMNRQIASMTRADVPYVVIIEKQPLPSASTAGVAFVINEKKWYYSDGSSWATVPVGSGGGGGAPGEHGIVDPTYHTVNGVPWDVIGVDTTDHLAVMHSSNDPTGAMFLRSNSSGGLGLQRLTTSQIYGRSALGEENINIVPSGSAGQVLIPNINRIGSATFSATSIPKAGWSIHNRYAGGFPTAMSELIINRILADELRVKIFVADETRVDRGILIIAKGYGILSRPFIVPNSPGDTDDIYFENSPVVTGGLFTDGDWVLIQLADFSGGGANLEWIWGQVYLPTPGDPSSINVTPPVPPPSDYIPEQRWRFTLRLGTAGTNLSRGSFVLGFGAPGQGYIVLDAVSSSHVPSISVHVWGLDSSGAVIPGATPYGSSGDGSLDLSSTTAKVVMGALDPALDTTLNPTGWGFYGTNTYLKGILQTNNIRIDNKGAALYTPSADDYSEWDVFGFRKLGITDNPLYSYYQGYWSSTDVKGRVRVQDTANARNASLFLESFSGSTAQAIISMRADNTAIAGNGASVYLERSATRPGFVSISGDHAIEILVTSATGTSGTDRINTQGDIVPVTHDAFSLGSAALKWKEIHVGIISADTIIGEAMGGAEWEFAGNMTIDANSASNTTLTITNQGAGVLDVIMDRDLTIGRTLTATGISVTGNIALTGTVDGVDLSAHVLLPDVHHPKQHNIIDATNHTVDGVQWQLVGVTSTDTLGLYTPSIDPTGAAILRTNPTGQLGLQGLTVWQIFSRATAGQENIELRPVTNGAVTILNTRAMRSDNFTTANITPIQGWSIYNRLAGVATTDMSEMAINRILADEMRVRVFVADEVRVDRGIQYIAKGYGILSRPFVTATAIGSSTQIYLENSPVIAGPLFSVNDWVLLQLADFSTGGAVLEWIWGQVTGYAVGAAPTDDSPGDQRWNFVLRLGSLGKPIKTGSFLYNFGAPGQGYIALNAVFGAHVPVISINVWGINSSGAVVPGSTPYGANVNGQLDTSNHKTMVSMGNLDPALDSRLTPSGWGFFGENAFLKGILQTDNALLDDKGVSIYSTSKADFSDFEVFGFRKDGVTDNPLLAYFQGYWSGADVKGRIRVSDTAAVRNSTLFLESYAAAADDSRIIMEVKSGSLGAGINLTSVAATRGLNDIWANHSINIRVTTAIGSSATNRINVQGDFVPSNNEAFNLGSAALRWNNVYAKNMVVDSITSGGTLTGATWSFPGAMVIDAENASTTTLTITNSGAGVVDVIMDRHLNIGGTLTAVTGAFTGNLAVTGNIGVGGTVDGVDLGAHVGDTNIHHNKVHDLVSADHTVSGLTTNHVLRAIDADSFGFGTTTSLVISDFNEAARDAVGSIFVDSTTVNLAYDDTGNTITATVIPGGISHNSLTGLTTGDPHTQYVSNTVARTISAVHTFSPGTATAPFILAANGQSQLVVGLRADQLNKQVIAGNGLTGTGTLTADVTLNVGAGTLISVAADAVGLANGTAQYQIPVTGATPFTPAYTLLSSFAGNGLTFGSAFNIALASPSGLVVTADTLAVDDSIAGAGLTIASKVLAVGGGTLLAVAADTIGLANGTAQYQVIVTGATPFTPAYADLSTFAGNGLTFGSGAFQITLASPSGLVVAADTLAVDDAIAGAGLAISGKVLAVGAGTLLTVAADTVGITDGAAGQFIGTGAGASAAWQNISLLAGAGLTSAGSTLAVGAGTLLTVGADAVGISNAPNSYYFIGSGADAVAEWVDMTTLAGAGIAHAAGVLSIGAGTLIAVGTDNVGISVAPGAHHVIGSGADTVAEWVNLSTLKGNGLTYSNGVLTIGAGTLIAIGTNDVGIAAGAAHQFIGTGTGTAATWRSMASLAGNGLVDNLSEIQVGAGDTTITVGSNDIRVNQGHAYVWTAGHQFTGTVQVQNTLTTFNIYPAATDTYDIGSSLLYYRQSFISQINAVLYAESTAQLLGGWFIVPKYSGKLGTVASGDTVIDLGPNPGGLIATGDFLVIRAHDTAGAVRTEYMTVGANAGGNTWNVTRDTAGAHGTDPAWADGTPYMLLGKTGDGRIELNATDTPRISLVAQGATYNAQVEYLRLGDLNAGWGYATQTWGFATGQYGVAGSTWVTVDPSNGFRIGNNVTTIGQWDATGTIYVGAQVGEHIKISGSAIEFHNGAAIHGSMTNDVWVLGENANERTRFEISAANGIKAIFKSVSGTETVQMHLDTVGNAYFAGTLAAASGTIGGWNIGATALTATNIGLYSGAANTARVEAGTGATAGGINAASSTPTDIIFWAGAAHVDRATAPFRVTAAGTLWATDAHITGEVTATSGTFTGTVYASAGSFTGAVTATTGSIGGWDIQTGGLTSTNIALVSGAANEARIVVGAGSNVAGMNSANVGTDIAFWAGAAYAAMGSAPFKILANGTLTATGATLTSATISGAITATTGSIGGWIISDPTISSVDMVLTSGANANITAGSGANAGGLSAAAIASDIVFWAGSTYANRAQAATPFRVTAAGALTALSGSIGGFTIGATSLTAGSGATYVGISTGTTALWAGGATPASAPFNVSQAGALTALSGAIGGWSISSAKIASDATGSPYITLTPGAANVANITVGTGVNAGGIHAPSTNTAAASGIVFWAGEAWSARNSADFRVYSEGTVVANKLTVGSTMTVNGAVSLNSSLTVSGAGSINWGSGIGKIDSTSGIQVLAATAGSWRGYRVVDSLTAATKVVEFSGNNSGDGRVSADGNLFITTPTAIYFDLDVRMMSLSASTDTANFQSHVELNAAPAGWQFRGQNGNTPTTPTYSFSGDPNTGMYRSAADTIAWATNGTVAMTLNGSDLLTLSGSVSGTNGTFTGTVQGATVTSTATVNGVTGLFTSGGVSANAGGAPATYTPYRFNNTHGTGLHGLPDAYVGLAVKDGWQLLCRTDNSDSYLALGYGNTNNRNPYIALCADGAAPTANSFYIQRLSGPNGNVEIRQQGTGSIMFYTSGSAAAYVNSANLLYSYGGIQAATQIVAGTYVTATTSINGATGAFSGAVTVGSLSATGAIVAGTTLTGDTLNTTTYGTAALPAIKMADADSGIWGAASVVNISTDAVNRINIQAAGISFQPVLKAPDGAVATPAYSFANETNTGFYSAAAGYIDVAALGVRVIILGLAGSGAAARPHIGIAGRDTGGTGYGPLLSIGRNTAAVSGGNGPAPGAIQLTSRDGGTFHIWTNVSGTLRMDATANGVGPIYTTSETGGTPVGGQSSALAFKDIVGPADAVNQIFEQIALGAEAVRRFQYKECIKGSPWSRKWNGEEFSGIVVDYAPRYGMDRSDAHPHGQVLNIITAIGDLMIGAAHLYKRINELEARVAELEAKLQ